MIEYIFLGCVIGLFVAFVFFGLIDLGCGGIEAFKHERARKKMFGQYRIVEVPTAERGKVFNVEVVKPVGIGLLRWYAWVPVRQYYDYHGTDGPVQEFTLDGAREYIKNAEQYFNTPKKVVA